MGSGGAEASSGNDESTMMLSRSCAQATRKKILAALFDVIQVEQTERVRLNDDPEPVLALMQRQEAQIFASKQAIPEAYPTLEYGNQVYLRDPECTDSTC